MLVSEEKSETRKFDRGVPQRNILRPTLFNIYTTELSKILIQHHVNSKMNADDTRFYFPVNNIDDSKERIQARMTEVTEWMNRKSLKLNEEKIECTVFGTKDSLEKLDMFEKIKVCTKEVKLVKSVRNLGNITDNNLNIDKQILKTVWSCNYQLRNIAFIRKYHHEDTIKKKLIHSYIVSNRLPNSFLRKLQVIKKKKKNCQSCEKKELSK